MNQKEIDTRMKDIIADVLNKSSRSRTSQISTHIDTWESNIMSDGNLLNVGLGKKAISKEFYDQRAEQLDKELSIVREMKHHLQKLYFPTPTEELRG